MQFQAFMQKMGLMSVVVKLKKFKVVFYYILPPDPEISGYVRDSNNNGVNGVTILFSNRGGSTSTNGSGYEG